MYIKHSTTKKEKGVEPIFVEQMIQTKNTRSKRHDNYYAFVESRVARRTARIIRGIFGFVYLGDKVVQRVPFGKL